MSNQCPKTLSMDYSRIEYMRSFLNIYIYICRQTSCRPKYSLRMNILKYKFIQMIQHKNIMNFCIHAIEENDSAVSIKYTICFTDFLTSKVWFGLLGFMAYQPL